MFPNFLENLGIFVKIEPKATKKEIVYKLYSLILEEMQKLSKKQSQIKFQSPKR